LLDTVLDGMSEQDRAIYDKQAKIFLVAALMGY
jgi:hypothetical protein